MAQFKQLGPLVYDIQSIRPQYHFRPSPEGLQAWDVRVLIQLSQNLTPEVVELTTITELNEPYWHDDYTRMTSKDVADHAKLIEEADLSFPIILCHKGRLMDGMHRVCKAYLRGHTHIMAVKFREYIAPHHIGKSPDELPYQEG